MSNNNTNYSSIPQDPERDTVKPVPLYKRKLNLIVGASVIGLVGLGIIASAVFLGKAVEEPAPKKNVIMMISDGFGPASETFARQYYTWLGSRDVKTMLPLDTIHVGHSRTQSSSSLVTDSAAGATAFSCAKKSYNGAIGVDPREVPCGTVLESAKIHKDMLTGLVVTSRITHATPAAFSSHVGWRDWENTIAEQQIGNNPLGRTVDLMFGGGLCEFLSNTTENSCRADDRDVLKDARDNFGWDIIHGEGSRQKFDAIKENDVNLPLMALFAPNHMEYEIDRIDTEQPALHEMVNKALSILKLKSAEKDTGFFLMIEGSRIDMAAHSNDPAAHVHDILEYQETVKLVTKFVDENPNTVVISTSDHETGGFTAGRQVGDNYPEYKWNPEIIRRVQNSSESLALAWSNAVESKTATQSYLRKVLIEGGLGIDDATEEEIDRVKAWKSSGKTWLELAYVFADMVSRRALIGWTTHGHTAVDVNLYAKGDGTEVLRGSHENTDIGDFIVDYLGLDLEDITQRLVKDSSKKDTSFQSFTYKNDKKPSVYHG